MSHPDPYGSPDLRPIQIGEFWENPVTLERVTIVERFTVLEGDGR
jgi:hypothetical protein